MTNTLTLSVPSSWEEVSLGRYQELLAIEESTSKSRNLANKIAILCDADPEDILKMKLSELRKVEEALRWTLVDPDEMQYIWKDPLTGIEYGMSKLESLSAGEWIDIEERMDNPEQNLHWILAVLYRPILKRIQIEEGESPFSSYEIEEYSAKSLEKRAFAFKQRMPVSIARTTIVFFSLTGTELMISSAISSLNQVSMMMDQMEEEMKPLLKEENENLKKLLNESRFKDGTGLGSLIHSQEGIPSNTKKPAKLTSSSHSTGLHTRKKRKSNKK